MNLILRGFFFAALIIASATLSLAQAAKKLEPELLAKDLEAIKLVPSLLPYEQQTTENVRTILEGRPGRDDENLGFGAHRFQFAKAGGYTNLSVNIFTLNGSIKDYQIAIRGNSESWPTIRSYIIEAWESSGAPAFVESDTGISYHKAFDSELIDYQKAVARELGELRPIPVPAELKGAYEYLISARENSVVSDGDCGYGGTLPHGKKAIDALMKANRIDLIENVLKGYNPGGRVYAALALLIHSGTGGALNQETSLTIEKIRNLEIKIETCSGCIYSHRTAKEILADPMNPDGRPHN